MCYEIISWTIQSNSCCTGIPSRDHKIASTYICIMLIKQLVVLCILILHDLTFYGFAFKDMLGRNCPFISYIKMVSLQPFCNCVSSYCVCIMYVCILCICGYVCRHRAHSILSPPFSVIPYSFPLAHSKHDTTSYFHYILPFCTLLNED